MCVCVCVCVDQIVQDQVKLQSMLDLYSITMEHSRYATSLPPPLNVIGLLCQAIKFAWQFQKAKKYWPKSCLIKRFNLYLSRNQNDLKPREYPSLSKNIIKRQGHTNGDEGEVVSNKDKQDAQELHLFMENARKDYLTEARGENETGVEALVTHMQETVVHMLEAKIEDRIQKIQDKLEQCFPADKEGDAGRTEDGCETFAVCGYLTDVESNFDYFERYLAISQIIGWADEESTYVPNMRRLKFKRDDAIFVFGGDSQDKGIGDIRFTKLLLELRQKYPGRVQFIIGNRDANKLRLSTELSEKAIRDPQVLIDKSFPYWDIEDKRLTPQMFLDQNKAENGGSENNAANRLRWILDKNMGSPGAFERRRHELSILRAVDKIDVSDEDVVASYRDEVDPAKPPGCKWQAVGSKKPVSGKHITSQGLEEALGKGQLELTKKTLDSFKVFDPSDSLSYNYDCYVCVEGEYFKPENTDGNNFMLQYLKHGKLAFVFGSNLFLHGAITEHNKGQVPGAKEPKEKVHDWVDALNSWAQSEVKAFEEDPHGHAEKKAGAAANSPLFTGIYTDRKGGGLIDYGVPGGDGVQGGGDKTVVYSNFLDNAKQPLFFKNNAKHLSQEIQEYLLKGKIKTVVTGHQPHGDCPCIIRSGAVTVITADTSIGKKGYKSKWGYDDDRGLGPPVSEVLVYADGTSEVHGVLLDGTKIAYKLGVGGDKFVGRQLSDGYWVKAKIAPGKDCADYNSQVGFKWKELGKPMEGEEIKNDALAAKLQAQQLEFTKEEWEKLKVSRLYSKCYIKAGDKYFQPTDGTTEEHDKTADDAASALRLLDRFDALQGRLDCIENRLEPEYIIAAMDGFAYKTRRMKLSELESLTDAHFICQRCHDEDLARAGIDSAFHGVLISAGLDIDTLKMAADDRRYLASELEKAGISKPGGNISRKSVYSCAMFSCADIYWGSNC